MIDQNEPEALLPNGADPNYVPVMGIDPVTETPKPKRTRKPRKNVAKPRAPRTPRIDPLLQEQASKASAAESPSVVRRGETPSEEVPADNRPGSPAGTAPLPRERAFKRIFSDNAPRPERHPPLKSGWGQRFVAGLRRMTGFDPVERATVTEPDGPEGDLVLAIEPKVFADLSRKDLWIWASLFSASVIAGLTMPWW